MPPTAQKPARLAAEPLEAREVPSVASAVLSGSTLVVTADDTDTRATVTRSGTDLVVRDSAAGKTWTFPASGATAVRFRGGAGGDTFTSALNLPLRADGGGGADRLNGGSGADALLGGAGDDTLIAVDDGTADTADGGPGRDGIWVDRATDGTADRTAGVTTGDKVQKVAAFANAGADRTLAATGSPTRPPAGRTRPTPPTRSSRRPARPRRTSGRAGWATAGCWPGWRASPRTARPPSGSTWSTSTTAPTGCSSAGSSTGWTTTSRGTPGSARKARCGWRSPRRPTPTTGPGRTPTPA
ncbi:MAG: hypothetical protein K2X82_04335 [Gemmataceae bacterium]|nr:hypothetical protein [Gemmataceae bacterium]